PPIRVAITGENTFAIICQIPIETSITAAEHIPIIIIDLSGILTLLKPYVSPTLQLSKLNVKANKIRDK
ncbi:hypothetical protein NYY86_21680, partial [Acinetobacter baumannii]|nr:hypothetical protein [Acinetobacter baumannii]